MKKVCISTFCTWNSYGSMLQAYGLQYALKQIECNGFIASTMVKPKERYEYPRLKMGSVTDMILVLHKWTILPKINKKYISSNDFIKRNIDIEYFGSYEALKRNPPQADAYLAGSDQVWNPRKIYQEFFLEHIPAGFPRITYAASMGVKKIPEETRLTYQRLVSSFDYVSLRECDTVPVICKCTDKMPDVHIDPVFLASQDHWKGMEVPYQIEEPYILVYSIYWDRKHNQELKQLHKKTGKNIVSVQAGYRRIYANKRIYDASPEQFLWLINHADAVVSSSFHGVAMSLIFNKPFAAIVDPNSSSRISCLLDILGAKNSTICELAENCAQDYKTINQRIWEERARSMTYLREVL